EAFVRILLSLIAVASIGVNAALFTVWQADEKKLRDEQAMRVSIYHDARQIIAELKASDPLTFTNVVVPVEVKP
ncbi:MAG TPA: hypothetical protein VN516_03515, partial [Candidatus Baltobacteraceae bacterium]|nr:hypothetical protein [Candidatus Baltobacteraceae bacterium]